MWYSYSQQNNCTIMNIYCSLIFITSFRSAMLRVVKKTSLYYIYFVPAQATWSTIVTMVLKFIYLNPFLLPQSAWYARLKYCLLSSLFLSSPHLLKQMSKALILLLATQLMKLHQPITKWIFSTCQIPLADSWNVMGKSDAIKLICRRSYCNSSVIRGKYIP